MSTIGFDSIGKSIIVIGLVFVVIGAIMLFGSKIPGLGRLPGDIRIEREGFTFYFPVVSGILISIILSLILNLFFRR